MPALIYVIDGEVAVRSFLTELLEDEGYTVASTTPKQCTLTDLVTVAPSLVIADYPYPMLPDYWHLLVSALAMPELEQCPLVVCPTGPNLPTEHLNWLETQHSIILPKPYDLDLLLDTISTLLTERPQSQPTSA